MTVPLTLPSLRAAYAQGTTVSEVFEQVYATYETINDDKIFISLRDKSAVLEEVHALSSFDPEMPLWGVPFAVKDNIDVAGIPTTAACPAYAYTPEKDAYVVARLRAAGAIVVGKTNLDQFATGLVGVRSPYGHPRNAIDPDIVPGGSSAGSGVAVAHGIVAFALGTDTAGSGRVPAALNNIVGLKPSLGSWSATGCIPACRSAETISVFALTVEDAHSVFQAGCGYDPEDPYSKKIDAPDLYAPEPGLRIAVPNSQSIKFFGDEIQEASFRDSLKVLSASGARVTEIDFQPFYDVAEMLYEGAWVAERYTVIEDLLTYDPSAVFPVTRSIIESATKLSAADAFRGFYRLQELKRSAESRLNRIDLICVPSIPTFYSCADLKADPVTPNSNLGTYTNFVNLMDMCALAVPTPARSDGRPGSVTLVGTSGQDALLASVGEDLEAAGNRTLGATNWDQPRRRERALSNSGTTQLVVCGAHMSGLALNSHLTDLGATINRETETSSDYKLYALTDSKPIRPGLVRMETGGTKIAVEVWNIPTKHLGTFLGTIPAPLGLGRVRLNDGTEEIGFLCEKAGIGGAADISGYGSWRAFLKA